MRLEMVIGMQNTWLSDSLGWLIEFVICRWLVEFVNVELFRGRWDSKWSSEYKTKSSRVAFPTKERPLWYTTKSRSVLLVVNVEMVIGIQNEIPGGESWGLFSNEPYEKKPVMTIEDFCFVFRWPPAYCRVFLLSFYQVNTRIATRCNTLQHTLCVAGCCSVLQCVAIRVLTWVLTTRTLLHIHMCDGWMLHILCAPTDESAAARSN